MISREEIAAVLSGYACPVCGAYVGKIVPRLGQSAAAFLNCESARCRKELFWDRIAGTDLMKIIHPDSPTP